MPPEPHRAGWENRKRSGQRQGCCRVDRKVMAYHGRYTRIGRMFISDSQRNASDCVGRRPRRSLDACVNDWRLASSRRVLRKRKGRVGAQQRVHQDRLVKKLRRKGSRATKQRMSIWKRNILRNTTSVLLGKRLEGKLSREDAEPGGS